MESLIHLPPLVSMKSLVHLDQFCPHTDVMFSCGQPGPGEHFTVPFWASFPLLERHQDVTGIGPSFLVALKALLNIPWRVTRLVNSIIQTFLSGSLSWEHIYCGQTQGVLCVSVPLLQSRRESVDQEKVLKINTSFCIISGHLFHDLQGYLSIISCPHKYFLTFVGGGDDVLKQQYINIESMCVTVGMQIGLPWRNSKGQRNS